MWFNAHRYRLLFAECSVRRTRMRFRYRWYVVPTVHVVTMALRCVFVRMEYHKKPTYGSTVDMQ